MNSSIHPFCRALSRLLSIYGLTFSVTYRYKSINVCFFPYLSTFYFVFFLSIYLLYSTRFLLCVAWSDILLVVNVKYCTMLLDVMYCMLFDGITVHRHRIPLVCYVRQTRLHSLSLSLCVSFRVFPQRMLHQICGPAACLPSTGSWPVSPGSTKKPPFASQTALKCGVCLVKARLIFHDLRRLCCSDDNGHVLMSSSTSGTACTVCPYSSIPYHTSSQTSM